MSRRVCHLVIYTYSMSEIPWCVHGNLAQRWRRVDTPKSVQYPVETQSKVWAV